VEITVEPSNLEAYKTGRILISKTNVKARYCIQKDDSSIRPELYHQTKDGAAWNRM
jgi:hypothetical protein